MTKARKQKLKELYLTTSSTKEVLSDFLDRLEVLDERFKKISSMPEFMDEIAEMVNELEHRFGGLKTTPGKQGKPGTKGTPGEQGKPGQDGSPDSPEQIRDKISSLEGKARLSVLALKDTEWLRKWINGQQNGNVIGTPGRFIDLLDAPDSYIGKSLMGVRVNAAETGLEFYVTGGGGSQNLQQTLAIGNVAGGQNITDLGDVEFRGKGELKSAYSTYVLGATSHGGVGKNNITLTGPYLGTSTPTFTYTITSLDEQVLNVDDISPFSVGDGVTGDISGVGTVLYVARRSNYIIVHATTSFAGDSTVFDTVSGNSANILSFAVSDVGTFTDGVTTLSSMPIFEADSISGVRPTTPGAINRYRLHTIGNSWSATVAMSTGSGHIFYGDLATDEFVVGDKNETGLGNIFSTDKNAGVSRWRMKDKLATYFDMEQGVNPTWSQLAGLGDGRYVGLDNNGMMTNEPSPLSIGKAVPGGVDDGVLFVDDSGNLKNNSSFAYHDQSGASTFKLNFPSGSFGDWININDNNATIQVGNTTSGYINANGGIFELRGGQVNISSLTANQVMSASPDVGTIFFGDIPSLGFGGVMDFQGQSGDIYFGTVTGTKYVEFDMMGEVFTLGNPFLNNYIQVNQVLETTALLGGILISQQYLTPTSGSTVTILDNMTSLRLNPSGTLTALTIVPPTAYAGRVFKVSTSQILTALSWSGTFKGAPTTLGANGFVQFEYSPTETAWVRTG